MICGSGFFCCLFALGLIIAMERCRCSRQRLDTWACRLLWLQLFYKSVNIEDEKLTTNTVMHNFCLHVCRCFHCHMILYLGSVNSRGRKERREGKRKKLRNSVRLDANTKIPEHLFLSISSSEGERGKLQK